jgi:putative endonuclease
MKPARTRTDSADHSLRKKQIALARGRRGEWLAAWFLRLKGYRVVECNFRCKLGEIDIVARRGDLVVFVEVKARPDPGEAIDAVGWQGQRRIADAANIWIGHQPDAHRLSWRFDIVAVPAFGLPRHFPNAF